MTSFLDGEPPRAIAHRGWHTGDLAGCENSMAAFGRAADEGYRYLETDVQLTSDGVLITFHDFSLDRATDGAGRVSNTPWSVVERTKIGGREPIPTFDQVMDLVRDNPALRLNVDPKTDAALDPLLAALTSAGLTDRVCVGSFSDRRLARVTAAGEFPVISMGPRAVARAVLASRVGRPVRRGAAVAAQVPHRAGALRVVTPAFVAAAHAAGVEVHVWTIDDPQEMRALLDLGVDGLMTDRPDLLKKLLIERGTW